MLVGTTPAKLVESRIIAIEDMRFYIVDRLLYI